jgi:hypothetical protein
MFFGDACRAEDWFVHSLGYPRPPNTSVVDYVLDLVSVNFNTSDASFNYDDVEEEEAGEGPTMRSLQDVTVASDTFLASRHFADCVPTKYVLCRLEKIGSISMHGCMYIYL